MGRKSRKKTQRIIRQPEPASIELKIIASLCLIIALSSLLGITEFHHFDNTRNGVKFFFLYSFLGLILCIPFYIIIFRLIPELRYDKNINKQWTFN